MDRPDRPPGVDATIGGSSSDVSRQPGRDIDDVRDATDLVQLIGEHVVLKPRGREHVGLCPFHDDHKPSFAVVTHKGNAFYKCHACGAAGDAFNFVMDYHKMDFPAALRYLAERAGITLKRSTDTATQRRSTGDGRAAILDANREAAAFFQRLLDSPAGAAAQQVLRKRNISAQSISDFQIGVAPDQWDGLLQFANRGNALSQKALLDAGLLKRRQNGSGLYDTFRNRLIFPICDELGRPIAFGGRAIDADDQPKYLNSPESPVFSKSKTLYGLHLAKRAIVGSEQAVVTEGYTDVIACHQAGIANVVATLGTALTREHAQLLGRLCHTVVLIFDGDEAGIRAADRAVEVFFAGRVDVKICVLPDNLDPDDLLRQPNGVEQFNAAIANAVDALEFKLQRFRSQLAQAGGLSARQRKLEDFGRDLGQLGFASMPGVRQALVVNRIAELLGLSAADVREVIPKQPPSRETPVDTPAAVMTEDADSEMLPEANEAAPPVTAVRRRAELDLLCLLIVQPELADTPIDPAGSAPAIQDVLAADDFADPNAAAVAAAVLPLLASGREWSVQQLMHELALPTLRNLVSTLYLEGQRRVQVSEEPPQELLRMTYAGLRRLKDREQYEQTLSNWQRDQAAAASPESLAEIIRGCSQQGGHSAALPRVR